ncbi:2Fe-2S ferredoxin, partial [Escherichia coli]|nr:2Fe-2S ferredoxin [Escherichia coli]
MTKINYIAFDGTPFEIDAENGSTVMENAVKNAVPGIEAECGGA